MNRNLAFMLSRMAEHADHSGGTEKILGARRDCIKIAKDEYYGRD